MDNKEKTFISAVIYVHNAEKYIESYLKTIIEVMESNFEYSEIICVNDSSEDDSLIKIKEVSEFAAVTSISVINMSYFHGLEIAMNAGVDLAIGDFVFEFDNTNLDFDAEDIMRVYYHCLEGFDVVSASPSGKEKISSWLFYRVFDEFSILPNRMNTESFRILSRRVINRISSMNKTIPYRKPIYASCGLKVDNLKYCENGEGYLSDKKEKQYKVGLAVDSLILFTEFGFKFSLIMTIIMMIVSVFMVFYSLAIYFTMHPVAGWTTTILFLSLAFFGLFGILTIVIKYLQLLIDLVFKKKQYSFECVEKITKQ